MISPSVPFNVMPHAVCRPVIRTTSCSLKVGLLPVLVWLGAALVPGDADATPVPEDADEVTKIVCAVEAPAVADEESVSAAALPDGADTVPADAGAVNVYEGVDGVAEGAGALW